MSKRSTSGLLGMILGGLWLLNNLRYFQEQGFVAIGMPLVVTVLGVIYFVRGKNQETRPSLAPRKPGL